MTKIYQNKKYQDEKLLMKNSTNCFEDFEVTASN